MDSYLCPKSYMVRYIWNYVCLSVCVFSYQYKFICLLYYVFPIYIISGLINIIINQ